LVTQSRKEKAHGKFSSGDCKVLGSTAGNAGLHGQIRTVYFSGENPAVDTVAEINLRNEDSNYWLLLTRNIPHISKDWEDQ
jgi:hypothetical protein